MITTVDFLYCDEDGLYWWCKTKYRDGDRRWFHWFTFDPFFDRWYRTAYGNADKYLYRLDRLVRERPSRVFITEGEKDTESLLTIGLPATTSGGVGSWHHHHSEQLQRHGCVEAIVLPDNDPPGLDAGRDIVHENFAVHIRSKLVTLPGLSHGQDVSDWLEAGATRDDLVKLADAAPYMTPADLPPRRITKTSKHPYTFDARLKSLYTDKLKLPKTATGSDTVLCPFHPDSKPSLSFDLSKLVFYCHGCRAKGGPADFLVFWTKRYQGTQITKREAWSRLKALYL